MRRKARNFLTIYLPLSPYVMVYMLQQVEYDPDQFLDWVNRLPDYRSVIRRKKLVFTHKARLLLAMSCMIWLFFYVIVVLLVMHEWYIPAVLIFAWIPMITVLSLASIIWLSSLLLRFKRRKDISHATLKMQEHKAIKIAVLGSYGKTTMKELLLSVLSESKKVAATPGNNNVAISHARWVMNKLTGDEEVLIIEFGEYKPGDIISMSKMFSPDIAIITGIAPNHLENYKTYDDLKKDISSVQQFVKPENIYVSDVTSKELGMNQQLTRSINKKTVLNWNISSINTGMDGLSFKMTKDENILNLSSQLIGEHLVEPLALSAALADKLGVTNKEIERGISKTKAFEHRMQPIRMNGALIIDDTYNGNIEGMRAGLAMLNAIEAKRKIYVTPGLVEQGSKTKVVHEELGQLITKANPDIVVLMENSVMPIIRGSLQKHKYKGEIRIESDPLQFYTGLQYEIAAGDVVLMQNDWTDNYA